jgi:hypothetical protein
MKFLISMGLILAWSSGAHSQHRSGLSQVSPPILRIGQPTGVRPPAQSFERGIASRVRGGFSPVGPPVVRTGPPTGIRPGAQSWGAGLPIGAVLRFRVGECTRQTGFRRQLGSGRQMPGVGTIDLTIGTMAPFLWSLTLCLTLCTSMADHILGTPMVNTTLRFPIHMIHNLDRPWPGCQLSPRLRSL